jgi:hypothetical protein
MMVLVLDLHMLLVLVLDVLRVVVVLFRIWITKMVVV